MRKNGYNGLEKQLAALNGKPVDLVDNSGEYSGLVYNTGNGKPEYTFVCRSNPMLGKGRTRILGGRLNPNSVTVDAEGDRGTILLDGRLDLAPLQNDRTKRNDLDRLRI